MLLGSSWSQSCCQWKVPLFMQWSILSYIVTLDRGMSIDFPWVILATWHDKEHINIGGPALLKCKKTNRKKHSWSSMGQLIGLSKNSPSQCFRVYPKNSSTFSYRKRETLLFLYLWSRHAQVHASCSSRHWYFKSPSSISHSAPYISTLAMNPVECAEVNSWHVEGKTISCLLAWNIYNKAKKGLHPKVYQLLLRGGEKINHMS